FEHNRYQALLCYVKDGKTFYQFMQDLFESADLEFTHKIGKDKSYFLVDDVAIMYDNDKALFVGNSGWSRDEKTRLIALNTMFMADKELAITNNAKFKKFYRNSKDISVFINAESILKSVFNSRNMPEADVNFENTSYEAHLNFEDDQIELSYRLNLSDENEAKFGPDMYLNSKISDEVLGFGMEQSILSAGFNVDLAGLAELYENMGLMKDASVTLKSEYGVGLNELASAIKGSMCFNFKGIEKMTVSKERAIDSRYNPETGRYELVYKTIESEEAVPMMTFTANLNDESVIKRMMEKAELSDTAGYYVIKNRTMDMYIGIKNNLLCATTTKAMINDFLAGKSTKPDPNITRLLSNPSFAYANLNMESYPKGFKDQIKESTEAYQYGSITSKYFSHIDLIGRSNASIDVMAKTTNNESNSLHQLMMLVDEIYVVERRATEF
ncbi:MAG: hypothetical protein ACI8ZN_001923, partial [Bacteroidia bacterium]